ncbi:hypothetical protein KAR28_06340 [Candidatus Parcubacteria bacterium]|nr:hypothetical protein [Candidatus Parcubacteria bacterium]
MTLYRDILGQSLKSAWRNKYLWFFGLFAALLGNAGEFELLFRGFNGKTGTFFPGLERLGETGIFSLQIFKSLAQLSRQDPFSLFLALGVLLLIVLVSLFLLWMSVTSQVALVHSAGKIRANKNHNFKESLNVGIKKFWPVFGLNIIFKIAVYALFIILSLPIISSLGKVDFALSSSLYIVSFVLFIPVSMIFSFIIKYAIAFVVIKEAGFLQAIKQGWKLFVKNWLVSLEMAFLLFFINFLVGAALILVFLIVSIPFFFMALVFAKLSFLFNFWAMVMIATMIYIIFIVLTGSFLSAFQVTSWTGLFIELVSRGGVSKLVRVFGKE